MEVAVSYETLVDLYEISRCHDSENYSLNNGDPTIHIQVSINAIVQTCETSGCSQQCIGSINNCRHVAHRQTDGRQRYSSNHTRSGDYGNG